MYQPMAPWSPPRTKIPASFALRGRSSAPRAQNQAMGRKKATPMRRPSRRWKYSHQKMDLKPSTSMSWLRSLNSGVSLYFSNWAAQSASVSGGRVPMKGCHSTIDRPEWVRRVAPPTTTMAKTRAQQASSQAATARRAARGSAAPARPGAGKVVAFTDSI